MLVNTKKKFSVGYFEFENMKIDIMVHHRKDSELTTRELVDNYRKLLRFRNDIIFSESRYLQHLIEMLYKTRNYKTYCSKLQTMYYISCNEKLYDIMIADKKAGIITKKMIEKDL